MTPSDQIEAERLYEILEEVHHPKTDYEKSLLQEVAREKTLLRRCQDNLFALHDLISSSAELHWDIDQTEAAAELARGLSKNPGLVRVQLSQTPHGAALQVDYWTRLGVAIERAGAWTDAQRHMALDLLGVPPELREPGQTEVDAPPGQDPRAVAKAVVEEQLQLLRDPRSVACRQQRDEYQRLLALRGTPAQISKEKRLMERYAGMHARRAEKAMGEFLSLQTARQKGEKSEAPTSPRPHTPAEGLRQYMESAKAESEVLAATAMAEWQARQAAARSGPAAPASAPLDREAEQARKKAEYDAHKAQKQQQKQQQR
jgi:hypothetical protein